MLLVQCLAVLHNANYFYNIYLWYQQAIPGIYAEIIGVSDILFRADRASARSWQNILKGSILNINFPLYIEFYDRHPLYYL